jgi:chromosome segregation ATPase
LRYGNFAIVLICAHYRHSKILRELKALHLDSPTTEEQQVAAWKIKYYTSMYRYKKLTAFNEKEKSYLKTRCKFLKTQSQEIGVEANRILLDYDRLMKDYNQIRNEKQAESKICDIQQMDIDRERSTVVQLKKELNEVYSALSCSRHELETSQDIKKEADQNIENLSNQIKTSKSLIHSLREENASLLISSQQREQRANDLEDQVKELSKVVKRNDQLAEELNLSIHQGMQNADSLKSKLDETALALFHSDEELKSCRSELDQLRNVMATTTKDYDNAKRKLNAYLKTIQIGNEEKSQLQITVDTLSITRNEIEMELNLANSTIQSLSSQVADSSARSLEVKLWRDRFHDTEGTVDSLREDLAALLQRHEEDLKHLHSLRDTLTDTTSQLQQARDVGLLSTTKIEELQWKVDSMSHQLVQRDDQLVTCHEQYISVSNQLAPLHSHINELESKNSELALSLRSAHAVHREELETRAQREATRLCRALQGAEARYAAMAVLSKATVHAISSVELNLLSKVIGEKNNTIEDLRRSRAEALNQLEASTTMHTKMIQSLETERDKQSDVIQSLREEVEASRTSCQYYKSELKMLEKRMDETSRATSLSQQANPPEPLQGTSKTSEQSATIASLNEQLLAKTTESHGWECRYIENQHKLNTMSVHHSAELKQWRNREHELEHLVQSTQSDLSTSKRCYQDAEALVKKLREECEERRNDIRLKMNENHDLKHRLDSSSQQLRELEDRRSEAQVSAREINHRLELSQKLLDEKDKEIAALQKESRQLSEMKSLCVQLSDQVKSLQSQLELVRTQSNHVPILQGEIQRYKEQIEKALEQKQDALKKLLIAHSDLKQVRSQLSVAEQEIESLTYHLDEKDSELKHLKQQVSPSNTQDLKEKIHEMEYCLEAMRDEVDSARAEVSKSEVLLEDYKLRNQNLETEVVTVKTQLTNFVRDNDRLLKCADDCLLQIKFLETKIATLSAPADGNHNSTEEQIKTLSHQLEMALDAKRSAEQKLVAMKSKAG